jgi:hypothetical protein
LGLFDFFELFSYFEEIQRSNTCWGNKAKKKILIFFDLFSLFFFRINFGLFCLFWLVLFIFGVVLL